MLDAIGHDYIIIIVTLCLIGLDVISGILKAAYTGTWDSSKMRKGIFHKAAFVLVMVMAIICQYACVEIPDMNLSLPLVVPTCVYLMATELLSIFENLSECNDKIRYLYDIFRRSIETKSEGTD